MSIAEQYDALTVEWLQNRASTKWSMFPGTIGAFVAEMDFTTAPEVSKSMKDAIDIGQTGYLPPGIAQGLREAVAAWYDRQGWKIDPAHVSPIPDVLTGLKATLALYSEPGVPVILPTPAYMPFFRIPGDYDREIIEVPMIEDDGYYTYDYDAIDKAMEQAGGGVFIHCNPFNPVGRVFTRDEQVKLAEIVERHGGRVFSDEIHAPLVFREHKHLPYASVSDAAAKHTITAVSASKAWNLPGLKAAALVLSNEADAAVWEEKGQMIGHGASTIGVIANTAAFNEGQAWLDETIAYIDRNFTRMKELLAEHLPEVRYREPEGTYITWLDWNAYNLEPSPAEFLREKAGVSLTDGIMCGAPGEGYTRMILAMPTHILEQAVKQMADAVNNR